MTGKKKSKNNDIQSLRKLEEKKIKRDKNETEIKQTSFDKTFFFLIINI